MGSIDQIIETLRSYREDCARDPETLREFWPKLTEIERKLSVEEKWTVIEQFCMAGIDLHDDDIIEACLVRLNKQFPRSKRVKLLNIMALCERTGDYDEAIRRYNEMIDEDETNAGARKRKIAVLISQRKNVDAIRELCEYLKIFMNDQEAWKELCELYMLEQDYQKAIFCMEELLLSHPLSHIYHTRLAEMYYTLNTHESIDQARSHYSQALKLNESNVRALHGLHLALKRLLSGNKLTAQQRKEFEKLDSWSITTLNSIYDKDGDQNVAKYMKVS
uniref:ER membrane protein complex subunit 2 n=1 Tax=Aceria tosichella TaxID=561515 RepID=A0A6G1SGG0_9ACAR